MLSSTDRFTAWQELCSLQAYALRSGEDLRGMIEVAPKVREAMLAFCDEYPRDADDVRYSLDIRDYMLLLLDRQEERCGPI